jgi:hypothetical protein
VGTWQAEHGLFYVQEPDGLFRNVVDAHTVCDLGHTGWYDNPYGESARDGSGLVIGVVAQIRGNDGMAFYIAGFRYGSHDDGGATFDTLTQYGTCGEDPEQGQRDAARVADGMAQVAGEKECDYQTAWQAGQAYAEKSEQVNDARKQCLEVLRERRLYPAIVDSPALCRALLDTVTRLRGEIQDGRDAMAKLVQGDDPRLGFWTGDDALRASFADGAELASFPA